MEQIKLGGYVDEEVKKINDNFNEVVTDYAKKTEIPTMPEIPTVPTKVSDLTNDAGYQTAAQVTQTVNAAVSGIDIPTVPTNVSAFTNDAGYVKTTDPAFLNKVDAQSGKGLSTNDYTQADKNKVDKLGKIEFATSNFTTTADASGYYSATLTTTGQTPVKVMRQNGSEYEEVLVHTKTTATSIVIVSSEAFAGYVVTM